MRAVIPFDVKTPKRRLSPVLDPPERTDFARAMLQDVLDAMAPTTLEPTVLATGPIEEALDAETRVDDRPLDAVIGAAIEADTPVAVVMADLPLVTAASLERLVATEGDVAFAPGRGGGTNAMVVRDPLFSVDYHGVSIRDHRAIAHERDLVVGEVDSYRLGTDIDAPEDLLEVLLHGTGESAAYLRKLGFRVETRSGRGAVRRTDPA
ncbi:MAG: 2-phospho-L-lactate guanylyltransferase [Halodesulfurarchaeum sp.]